MNVHELAKLVKRMREAQARYLAERRSDVLAEVVRIERQVDQAVADVLCNNPMQLGDES